MNLAWLLAEFIGTFTLIFIGAGSICLNEMTQGSVGLLGIAAAHGLAIGVMVTALAQISGGKFNPAISLGLWAGGKQAIKPTIYEIVAQLLGGIVAAFCLKIIFPAGCSRRPWLWGLLALEKASLPRSVYLLRVSSHFSSYSQSLVWP